ncbi:MAG: hypothetical protein IJS39_01170 [Synergistaceae bacterium]|nr:hypothetical protein [Synergistaceae bacterium]
MLTLSAAGKSIDDIETLIHDALTSNPDEEELKILIDGPSHAGEVKKILEAEEITDVVPEDDDGMLYLLATRKVQKPEPETEPAPESESPSESEQTTELKTPPTPKKIPAIPNSTGILISCEAGKFRPAFMAKFTASLAQAKTRPDVIGLMNGAVSLAAYNAPSCDDLKQLEAEGVQILVSGVCSDRLGMTEALGAGSIADMSEILDAVLSCEKIISI